MVCIMFNLIIFLNNLLSINGVCLCLRCPVCRYCQTPEPVEENKCFECGVQEVSNPEHQINRACTENISVVRMHLNLYVLYSYSHFCCVKYAFCWTLNACLKRYINTCCVFMTAVNIKGLL